MANFKFSQIILAVVLGTLKSVKFTYCEKICVYSITLSVLFVGVCVSVVVEDAM